MKLLVLIVLTLIAAVLCFGIGSLIGKLVGKSIEKRAKMRKNGSSHD